MAEWTLESFAPDKVTLVSPEGRAYWIYDACGASEDEGENCLLDALTAWKMQKLSAAETCRHGKRANQECTECASGFDNASPYIEPAKDAGVGLGLLKILPFEPATTFGSLAGNPQGNKASRSD